MIVVAVKLANPVHIMSKYLKINSFFIKTVLLYKTTQKKQVKKKEQHQTFLTSFTLWQKLLSKTSLRFWNFWTGKSFPKVIENVTILTKWNIQTHIQNLYSEQDCVVK